MRTFLQLIATLLLFTYVFADAPPEKTGGYKSTADSVQGGKITDGEPNQPDHVPEMYLA